jgi:hypothetical protein
MSIKGIDKRMAWFQKGVDMDVGVDIIPKIFPSATT